MFLPLIPNPIHVRVVHIEDRVRRRCRGNHIATDCAMDRIMWSRFERQLKWGEPITSLHGLYVRVRGHEAEIYLAIHRPAVQQRRVADLRRRGRVSDPIPVRDEDGSMDLLQPLFKADEHLAMPSQEVDPPYPLHAVYSPGRHGLDVRHSAHVNLDKVPVGGSRSARPMKLVDSIDQPVPIRWLHSGCTLSHRSNRSSSSAQRVTQGGLLFPAGLPPKT